MTAIETALAHAEAALEDIGGLVREQDARIRQLERSIAILADRIATAETVRPGPDQEMPPPHY